MAFSNRFDSMFPSLSKPSNLPDFGKVEDGSDHMIPHTSTALKTPMVLNQFGNAWDVQAFALFSGIKLHIQNSRYPEFESTGELPQLSDGNFLVGRKDILTHLQTYHHSLDNSLSSQDRAQVYALSSLVQNELHNVLLYCQWVDMVNYTEVTNPSMRAVIPFPFNQYLPKQLHQKHRRYLVDNGISTKEQAFLLAKDIYTTLSTILDKQKGPFFFGTSPTSLDAIVFGHMMQALNDVLLHDVVKEYGSNLIEFTEAIYNKYFTTEVLTSNGPNRLLNFFQKRNMDEEKNSRGRLINSAKFMKVDTKLIPQAYESISKEYQERAVKDKELRDLKQKEIQQNLREEEKEAENMFIEIAGDDDFYDDMYDEEEDESADY